MFRKRNFPTYLLFSLILIASIANASATLIAFAQAPMPVSGAIVTAASTSGAGGSGTAASNLQGFYNITTFLDSGNYTVEALAPGYIETMVQNVRVTAGQETQNVNILMPISGAISGRVTDAVSGTPLRSIIVAAANISGGVTHGFEATTDSSGNYLINTDLPTGVYNVSTFFAAGYMSKTLTGISVTAGATTSNVNIALNRSATITGTVTDSVSSAALNGISVYAVSSSGASVAFGQTNSSGKYTLNTDLGSGTYNVTVLFPANHIAKTMTGVAVVAGNTYTVNIALDPSGVISGRVTSTTGSPIAGATVTATSGESFGFATTNSTGYYRITDGLATGSYIIFASFGTGFNTVLGISVTQGQETSNVNIQLTITPSGTITGRVTNSTGFPLESATVEANGLGGSGFAQTDSNGTYTINTGLGTGTYNVTASKTGYNSVSQVGVVVTVNQVTAQVNFQLSARTSGRISGLVQSLSTPIPEFHTELYMLAIFVAASAVIMLKKMRSAQFERTKPL